MSNPILIAEIAQAHEGSLGIAHSYIDALADCGVDCIKFQTHIAEAESSAFEAFRINFSYEDKTRYDYWKRMEFTQEQWAGLKKHCEDRGVEFLSSPFSIAAVKLLESINVNRYKIGSGELSNYLMLEAIAQTKKPIILSSGMSNWQELDECIGFLKPHGNQLSLMQCTTAYPTEPHQWGLQNMQLMKERYQIPVGFSDHSGDIFAALAAATLGAELIEFHAVFHHQLFGPDTKASLTIAQIAQLVKGVRQIDSSLTNVVSKDDNSQYETLKNMFGKSLATNRAVKKGEYIQASDLESKKPGNQGIAAKHFQQLIGKKWLRNLDAHTFITSQDIE
jgi:N-acetylneuraminate synthase